MFAWRTDATTVTWRRCAESIKDMRDNAFPSMSACVLNLTTTGANNSTKTKRLRRRPLLSWNARSNLPSSNRVCVRTTKARLQRLKPHSLRGVYVVAEATTHKHSRAATQTQKARDFTASQTLGLFSLRNCFPCATPATAIFVGF